MKLGVFSGETNLLEEIHGSPQKSYNEYNYRMDQESLYAASTATPTPTAASVELAEVLNIENAA